MKKTLITLAALSFGIVFAWSQADIFIGLTSYLKPQNKLKIVINKFALLNKDDETEKVIAENLQSTIRADLMYCRYFDVEEQDAPQVDFKALKKQDANYVVEGRVAYAQDEKRWMIRVKVSDVKSGKKIVEKYYKGKKNSVKRGAHVFSDYVVWKLTGKKGIARTRIAFANNSTKKKEIYVCDYDGENLIRLTNDKSIALLPKWSPDGNKLYYTTYKRRNPDLYEINLVNKTVNPVSVLRGINLPGGFSPDGKSMVLTHSHGRDPNIYLMNMETKKLTRLTHRRSVESSAGYSPDGRFVTFISDRSGNPQIHIMELATGKIQRLTRLNWCDSPKWSPTGEWITFSGRISSKDNLDIYLVDITGFRIRRLTRNAGSNEDPSWSPDGRFIAFTSTRNGKREIFVMDSDGSAPHLVGKLPGNSFTPSWSP
ncbi:MAG TPA: DPP IV N-terminal domain-containing protein [Elusimicrobiales bacterium]|nr:DPP IV N-terminal domain-containing protein [Elusimicrobiales bacterium]